MLHHLRHPVGEGSPRYPLPPPPHAMDEFTRRRLEQMLGGLVPTEIENLCARILELTRRANGPSHLAESTLALICVMAAVPPETPRGAKDTLDHENEGDMIIVRIGDDEVLCQFQGKGPGGRYRVRTEAGDTKLIPKEAFLNLAEKIRAN